MKTEPQMVTESACLAQAHTNEMYQEQEAELEALKERRVTTEAYIEELRARVGKLVERESTTEVGKSDPALEHGPG